MHGRGQGAETSDDVGPWTALLAPPENALFGISLRELANMTDVAIGIDLGTTYRCAAER